MKIPDSLLMGGIIGLGLLLGVLVCTCFARQIRNKKQGIPIRFCLEFGKSSFKNKIFYLKEPITIGRRGCTIVLKDRSVELCHARIYQEQGVLYIENLGVRSGTYLGGMRIIHPNRLRSNDVISIGECQIRLLF